jgi:hypothetical protein
MKQIMVEVPDSMSDERAQFEIDRAFSPDWISLHWHISDVQDIAGDCTPMSDEDARDILAELNDRRDLTWDVINNYVDKWRDEQ